MNLAPLHQSAHTEALGVTIQDATRCCTLSDVRQCRLKLLHFCRLCSKHIGYDTQEDTLVFSVRKGITSHHSLCGDNLVVQFSEAVAELKL